MDTVVEVDISFDDWKKQHGNIETIVQNGINENDDVSVITESVTINQLGQQADLYESEEQEELNLDTLRTMKRYLKKIYRGAKFLSDSGKNYKEPNFILLQGQEQLQLVQICEFLWKSLGKIVLFLYKMYYS